MCSATVRSCTLAAPLEGAIIVSDVVVQIEARLFIIAVYVGELGDQDVAILEGNVLGAEVKVNHACKLRGWAVKSVEARPSDLQ